MTADPLTLVRGVHFAATMLASGTIGFIVLVGEPAASAARFTGFATLRRQLTVLVWLALTVAVLSGIVWAMENPNRGVVEPDEMDFRRCLEIQLPYLGPVKGYYTDWTPLQGFDGLFGNPPDKRDPWQFSNILVP